jgi:uncharacterized membrane protein (DUF4010 family)
MLEIFSRLGIALGLGLLVGLQRQRTDSRLAGIRTFPLVTLFGALCGMLAENFGGWTVAAGMGALALIILGGNFPLLRAGEERPGVTTEVTMLVMFGLGAYAMVGSLAITIATCGAVVVLLHLKPQMHSIAQKIGDRDFTAIMQFTLISLVILPVLPNRVYGPFEVLNPFKIWLMVVLIVGISLGGYVAYKVIGVRGGAWVSGVLGGLISSTATTVSVARRSKESPGRPELAGFVIIIASAIVFLRVGILVGVTAPQFLRAALFPLLAMFTVLALLGWASLRHHGNGSGALPEQTNPTELKPALLFGLLYAVVLLAAAAAYQYFGRQGLYVTAIISGLTDMDAITLSVTHLVNAAEIPAGTGWRVILGAAMANLAFKTATVAMLGEQRLLTRVAGVFGAAGVIGLALLFFGPQ